MESSQPCLLLAIQDQIIDCSSIFNQVENNIHSQAKLLIKYIVAFKKQHLLTIFLKVSVIMGFQL